MQKRANCRIGIRNLMLHWSMLSGNVSVCFYQTLVQTVKYYCGAVTVELDYLIGARSLVVVWIFYLASYN